MSESQANINQSDAINASESLVLYILNNAASKFPIKLSDLNEVCRKDSKMLKHCLQRVSDELQDIYGIILEEVPTQKSYRRFICYSEFPTLCNFNEEQKRQTILLYLILSYIFMVEKPVYESELEAFLVGLKIYFDRDHEYFGDNIKKLVTETFVKQLYLHREKSDSELDTEVKFTYSWGFRAEKEFNKRQLLNTTADILGKPPQFFVSQYRSCEQMDTD